jgi:arsenate reductase-like glutaredoxin family protein
LSRKLWEKLGFLKPVTISKDTIEKSLRASGLDTEALARQRNETVRKANAKRAATIAKKRIGKAAQPKPTVKRISSKK